jgi:phage-related protein
MSATLLVSPSSKYRKACVHHLLNHSKWLEAVNEIRENDESGTYRAVYTAELGDFVFILHVFQKKSKSGIATPKQDIELIKQRLKEAKYLYEEKSKEGQKK